MTELYRSSLYCAAVGLADVQSANIVGYNTVTLKPGFNMLAVNFKNVADADGIEINDLFPGGGKETALKAAATSADADVIKVHNAETGEYTTYFLFKPAKNVSTNPKSYFWVDPALNVVQPKFKNGDSFWYISKNTGDVTATVSGEVELSAVKTIDIKNGFNMIGSFFPAGWTLNDELYTPAYWQNCGAISAATSADADVVKVHDAATGEYSTYFLFKPAKNVSTNPKSYHWVDPALNIYSNKVMEAGQGAWYIHKSTGFTLDIKNQTGITK